MKIHVSTTRHGMEHFTSVTVDGKLESVTRTKYFNTTRVRNRLLAGLCQREGVVEVTSNSILAPAHLRDPRTQPFRGGPNESR